MAAQAAARVEATAVAARLTPLATGTDTGGSIRQPAALCGITGLKPTYGRVSRYGIVAFASSLDQAGPMSRSAEDAAWLLGAMAGFDERDSTSVDQPIDDYRGTLADDVRGLKIGLPEEYFGEGLDSQVESVVGQAISQFEALGAQVESDFDNRYGSGEGDVDLRWLDFVYKLDAARRGRSVEA